MERHTKWLYIMVFLGLTALAAWGLYLYRPIIYTELNTLKLIPRPERFTELYLNDHTTLPKTLHKGAVVPFSFTIHNLNGQTVMYHYVVYAQSIDGSTTTIDTNTVRIDDGESTIIRKFYTYNATSTPITIYIELPDQGQTLHFMLPSRE